MTTARMFEAAARFSVGSKLGTGSSTFVDASQFHALMVSHRRMVREKLVESQVRGLRDLDTGELFLTDERRLFDARR